jgi:hypothetical protein
MKPDPNIYMPLALVLQDLRSNAKLTVNQSALNEWTHRRLSSAVLDGKIPAERINGRWYVKWADLTKIAELLGVTPKPRVGRPPRSQVASAPSNAAIAA